MFNRESYSDLLGVEPCSTEERERERERGITASCCLILKSMQRLVSVDRDCLMLFWCGTRSFLKKSFGTCSIEKRYDTLKYNMYQVCSNQRCHLCFLCIVYITTGNSGKTSQFSTKQGKYQNLIKIPAQLISETIRL